MKEGTEGGRKGEREREEEGEIDIKILRIDR